MVKKLEPRFNLIKAKIAEIRTVKYGDPILAEDHNLVRQFAELQRDFDEEALKLRRFKSRESEELQLEALTERWFNTAGAWWWPKQFQVPYFGKVRTRAEVYAAEGTGQAGYSVMVDGSRVVEGYFAKDGTWRTFTNDVAVKDNSEVWLGIYQEAPAVDMCIRNARIYFTLELLIHEKKVIKD